jgi:hypothetical protein
MEITPEKILLIIGLILFFGIFTQILFYKKNSKKIKKDDDVKENEKSKQSDSKIEHLKAKYVMDFINDLIKRKYEYYLYKDILPVYIGNEFSKKEKFSKERFLELKEFFFNDIFMSLSPEMKKELVSLFSPSGIEIYIHQQFATYFNKTDAKFLNIEEEIKDNMFFMSDIETNTNIK